MPVFPCIKAWEHDCNGIDQFLPGENNQAGYQEVQPPLMVNADSGYGTGQLPDKDGQMYYVNEDNLYLIPTAEVPVTQHLPRRHSGRRPSYR